MGREQVFRSGCGFIAFTAALLVAAPCRAHPSDEANVYHYLWLEAKPREVSLQHATVVGGLVAGEVWPRLDPDSDRQLSPDEQERAARVLADGLSLQVDGRPVRWELEAYEFPSHEEFFGGSFPAAKLLLVAKVPPLPGKTRVIRVQDGTYPNYDAVFPQPVVRPSGVVAGEPVTSRDGRVTQVRLAAEGRGQGAGARGQVAGRSPQPAVGGAGSSGAPSAPEGGSKIRLPGLSLSEKGDPERDRAPLLPGLTLDSDKPGRARGIDDFDLQNAPIFSDRGKVIYATPPDADGHGAETGKLKGLLGRPLGLVEILLGLGAALLAGAVHALTPGHGKAMVGAYLVGTRGTVWDAILLGIVVTVTHTASIYLLGFLCLWLTTRISVQTVGLWLSLTSGLIVLGMGFWLFQRGLLAYHGIRPLPGHTHGDGEGHGHTHVHGHAHTHPHSQETGVRGQGSGVRGEASVPVHPAEHSDRRSPSDSPLEVGGTGASPNASEYSRWGVIGLGVAGGMVPCFDALAIMIAAVNLGSIAVGLALIAAFSVGMALVLILLGVLMVAAKDLMARFTGESRWVKALPAVSGAVLFFLGAWLTLQGMVEAGWMRVG